jgi:MFS family permease
MDGDGVTHSQAPPSAAGARTPARASLRGLDWLNFFLADLQAGVGPFLAIYLAGLGWDEGRVGWALTVGGLAGIAAQTPAGWLVDRAPAKRALVAIGALVLGAGALLVALWPLHWVILTAQVLMGAVGSLLVPAICAISLGMVGHHAFDARQGRNQAFNAAGNIFSAAAMGATAYLLGDRATFILLAGFAAPALAALATIRARDIDHALARGAAAGSGAPASPLAALLADRPLLVFFACAVLFHFANAAMLPLVGQKLAHGQGASSMAFMAACVITTQVVVAFSAGWIGRAAAVYGRKALLLAGFGVLPLRGVLYTLTDSAPLLIAIQVLDGIGAAVFGVLSVLVIADLTRGSGRFNLTLGAISTAVGIGASLSQWLAGELVHRHGFRAGMLFLAAIALLALVLLAWLMPETLSRSSPSPSSSPEPPPP